MDDSMTAFEWQRPLQVVDGRTGEVIASDQNAWSAAVMVRKTPGATMASEAWRLVTEW